MAAFVFKNGFLTVNGVDLSDHVLSMTLNYSAELQDQTAMGDATRRRLPGLKDWSLEVQFKQDFDSGSVDATMFDLVGAAAFPIRVRADQDAAISDTNPEFQGNGLLESYPPLAGQVGSLATVQCTIQGDGTMTRDVIA